MAKLSRRTFIGSSAASIAALGTMNARSAAALTEPLATAAPTEHRKLRVRYITGGHTVPIPSYAMFASDLFSDLDTEVFPRPDSFRNLNSPTGPDVLVLYDYLTTEWDEHDKAAIKTYLDSGKGLVILHHAIAANQHWPYWYREITGGELIQLGVPGVKRSRLKQFPMQTITPVGNNPIVRGLKPFTFARDEVFSDMWVSPKITPLLMSSDPDIGPEKAIAWIGLHPKGKVIFYQSGHTPVACADPRLQEIIHRMVLYSGGRLA